MINNTSTLPNLAERASGEAAMARLADRLTAMAPPPMNLSPTDIVRPAFTPSPALSASAAIARRAHERALALFPRVRTCPMRWWPLACG